MISLEKKKDIPHGHPWDTLHGTGARSRIDGGLGMRFRQARQLRRDLIMSLRAGAGKEFLTTHLGDPSMLNHISDALGRSARFCLVAGGLALAGLPATGATFNIALGGAAGVFTAPAAGGLVSAFALTRLGVTFDVPDAGSTAPNYRPAFNDFRGTGGGTSGVRNSAAGGGCAVLDCALLLEDTFPPGSPPFEWSILRISTLENLGFGEPYAISPIPLPAAGPALAAAFGLAGLLLTRRRRSRRPAAA